jgi:hypothetical protein
MIDQQSEYSVKIGSHPCLMPRDSDELIIEGSNTTLEINTNCTVPDIAAGRYNVYLTVSNRSVGFGNAKFEPSLYNGVEGI